MITKNKIRKNEKLMQIKIFGFAKWNIYLVVFIEFFYSNKFFIQSKYNKNTHT